MSCNFLIIVVAESAGNFSQHPDFRIDLKLTAREIVAQLMASLEFGFYEAAKFSSLIEAAGQSTYGKADGQKAIWTKGRKRGSADWQSFDERSTSKESF